MNELKTYCGVVAIVGRSNVGKSTLLNQLFGQKISITSRKPQTTRYRIIGIKTESNHQMIYVDTPGLHVKKPRIADLLTNRVASSLMDNVELIIFVVVGTHWTINDEMMANKLRHLICPVLLVINKIDLLINKTCLLPYIKFISNKMNFLDIIPISAKNGTGVDFINKIVRQHMPEALYQFPAGNTTNCQGSFMAAEIIREKLMRFLGDELPYSVVVKIKQFVVNQRNCYNIHALILIEKDSQKKIIIGNKGSKIKKIGIESRIGMEKFFASKVYLELWVKVRK